MQKSVIFDALFSKACNIFTLSVVLYTETSGIGGKRMKKKGLIVLIAVLAAVVLLTVLCIPQRYELKDGGSVVYEAVLYCIEKVHSMQADTLDGQFVFLVGTTVDILGVTVYENVYFADGSGPLPTLPPGEKSMLYVLDPEGTVQTFQPGSVGMTKLALEDRFYARMERNGCLIDYNDGHPNYDVWVVLRIGEEMTAQIGEGPEAKTYRIYLAADNAPLPEGWNGAAD